jgi:hypothetical protein
MAEFDTVFTNFNDIKNDLINIYSKNKLYFTKSECKNIIDTIYNLLFDENITNKNFILLFSYLNPDSNDNVSFSNIESIVNAFIIAFDVNFITNKPDFNDKICIKMGKNLLPSSFYIKYNNDNSNNSN